jgi:hypothetical protein
MAKKQTSRGRKQDRARVAGRQDYEVGYAAKKSRKSNCRKQSREEGGQQPQTRRTSTGAVACRLNPATIVSGRSEWRFS